jgi:tetratricopeptide (TPR) repeat protein
MKIDPDVPAYSWSRDKLRLLLEHPWDEVQSWAACRILDLYPEAKDEMLLLLPHASPAVALHLLDGLKELPLVESAVNPLLEFFHRVHRPMDRAIAAVLLLRCGYDLPYEELAALPLQQVAKELAQTVSGFGYLLQRMVEESEEAEDIYYGLACGCASEGAYELLNRTQERKKRSEVLGLLEKQWKYPLPDVHRVKDIGTALRLLEDSLVESRPLPEKSARFATVLAELAPVSERCVLLAAAVRDNPGRNTSHRQIPLLLGCSLSLLRDAACRKALLAGDQDIAEVWRALTMRPWPSARVDKETVELLRSKDPEQVLSSLREMLGRQGWVYGEYAFRYLESAAVPGRYHLLLEALDGEWGYDISEDAEGVLRKAGPGVVEVALEHWYKQLPRASKLWWLEMYPTQTVVQFLLSYFEHYFASPDSRIFIELLGEVGSREFFEPLLREWRSGEVAIGNTIRLIAELNNVQDGCLDPIIQDTDKWSADALISSDEVADLPIRRTSSIPLRCTACGRTYHYPLERLYLDDKGENVVIGEIVQCRGCGSIETYEMTMDTKWTLSAELIRTLALGKSEEIDEEGLPFKGQLMGVTAAGHQFKTVSEAYHFLRRAVEREPANADLKKRLGNVLRNGNRSDLALPYYQEALQLDPRDAETTYSVAAILLEQKRFGEATRYVEELARLIREEKLDDRLRRALFSALIDQAGIIYEQTGHQIQIWPRNKSAVDSQDNMPLTLELKSLALSNSEEFEQAYHLFLHGTLPERGAGNTSDKGSWIASQKPMKKVGRNDPCPCGSGRKFKKCCGR